MEKQPVLELYNITKTFPGIKALDQVNIRLYPGEVHIIAGENGAGKSTLIKSILGIYSPEEGEIRYENKKVSFLSSKDSIDLGIFAVHQELTMIPYLSVAENIFFGMEPHIGRTPFLDRKRMNEEARKILARLKLSEIDVREPVKHLGVANQQMIEIAKVLARRPKVILFDEPTSSLSDREVDLLFDQIKRLKAEGIAIIYVSHRMKEFFEIGDRVTVLRDGRKVYESLMAETSLEEITREMMGHQSREAGSTVSSKTQGDPILRADHLGDRRGKVRDASLLVYPGEIVGLAGLVGAGRTELANLIFGMEKKAFGEVYFKGENVTRKSPDELVKRGMAYLPEDRKNLGLALKAPVGWNLLAASLPKYFPHGILNSSVQKEAEDGYIKDLKIATLDGRKTTGELSGGNQQKIVLGKWLATNPDLLIFDEPTKGVDIGVKLEIYDRIRGLAREGKGILFISSELEELTSISDRIYTMADGELVGELKGGSFDSAELGSLLFAQRTNKEAAKSSKKKNSLPPAIYMILLLMLIFGIRSDHYFAWSNFSNILNQAVPLMVAACGQTLILLIQGTDLSIGAMMSLSGVFWIYLMSWGIPPLLALLASMAAGCVLGAANGFLAGKGWIPIFIVTMGTQNIFKSMALLICNNETLYYDTSLYSFLTGSNLLGLTWSVWIAGLCVLITWILLKQTTFGMRVRGIGGNEQALRFHGVDVNREKIKIFAYAGFMAVVAGFLLACRIASGNPNAGNGMEFNAIAAVLLGGTSMREGRGGVIGTIFGVLLIQILKSGLMQVGISSIYQNAIIGTVVLVAIIVDAYLKKREEALL